MQNVIPTGPKGDLVKAAEERRLLEQEQDVLRTTGFHSHCRYCRGKLPYESPAPDCGKNDERHRRGREGQPVEYTKTCSCCGRPLRIDNKSGICSECRRIGRKPGDGKKDAKGDDGVAQVRTPHKPSYQSVRQRFDKVARGLDYRPLEVLADLMLGWLYKVKVAGEPRPEDYHPILGEQREEEGDL